MSDWYSPAKENEERERERKISNHFQASPSVHIIILLSQDLLTYYTIWKSHETQLGSLCLSFMEEQFPLETHYLKNLFTYVIERQR